MSDDRRASGAPSDGSGAGRDGEKKRKKYYGKGKKYRGGAKGSGSHEGAGDSGAASRGGRDGGKPGASGRPRDGAASGSSGRQGKSGDGRGERPRPSARPAVPPRPPRETVAERRARNLALGPAFGTRSVVSRGEDLGGLRARMMTAAGESARERAMRVAAGLDYGDGDGGQFDY